MLELTVTISAITFLIPWGQLQFGGLLVALGGLGWHINPAGLVIFAVSAARSGLKTVRGSCARMWWGSIVVGVARRRRRRHPIPTVRLG